MIALGGLAGDGFGHFGPERRNAKGDRSIRWIRLTEDWSDNGHLKPRGANLMLGNTVLRNVRTIFSETFANASASEYLLGT